MDAGRSNEWGEERFVNGGFGDGGGRKRGDVVLGLLSCLLGESQGANVREETRREHQVTCFILWLPQSLSPCDSALSTHQRHPWVLSQGIPVSRGHGNPAPAGCGGLQMAVSSTAQH